MDKIETKNFSSFISKAYHYERKERKTSSSLTRLLDVVCWDAEIKFGVLEVIKKGIVTILQSCLRWQSKLFHEWRSVKLAPWYKQKLSNKNKNLTVKSNHRMPRLVTISFLGFCLLRYSLYILLMHTVSYFLNKHLNSWKKKKTHVKIVFLFLLLVFKDL